MAQTSGVFPQLSDNVKKSNPKVSKTKAREILSHGEVRGHKLTRKQRGLFGMVAVGRQPTRLNTPTGFHTRRAMSHKKVTAKHG